MNFSREEWYGIYEDAKDYAPVFGVEMIWDEAEKYSADKKARTEAALSNGEIILGGGHMTVPQLEALLNTLPIEITFVDDNNINRFLDKEQRCSNALRWRLTGKYFLAIHLR